MRRNADMKRKMAKAATEEVMQKVKLARVRANLSQRLVADEVGVSQSAWSHYEQGRRSISLEAVLLLPSVLNCSVADLLPDSIVTAVDQRRSRDFRLEEIVIGWTELSDSGKESILETYRARRDVERLGQARDRVREVKTASSREAEAASSRKGPFE